jgi:hypothetical protein
MAVAAADRAIITRLERELRDLFAAVCAGPATLDHITLLARAALRTSRAACAVAVATLQGVELVVARLERQLCDRRTALRARPIPLHHRARRIRTGIITVHRLCLTRYVLLTHDPLERNHAHLLRSEPTRSGSSNVRPLYTIPHGRQACGKAEPDAFACATPHGILANTYCLPRRTQCSHVS